MLRLKSALIALFLLMALSHPAMAVVTVVTASPGTSNISYNPGSSTFTVTWIINRTLIPGPFTLSSPPGTFFISSVIGSTNTITRVIPGNPKTLSITETVTVPQFVMRSALETNDGQFSFQRSFSDDGVTFVQGAATVNVTGGMGGPLGLSEVTLTFDNNSTFSSVHENDTIRAIAHIHSSGAGQLTGIWEVSDVNAGSSVFYRPIRTETVTLTGQRIINVTSPLLLTDSEGRYNVRFRVIQPANSRITPQITYFVNGKGKNTKGGLSPSSPDTDANVGNGTPFKWNAIKGAAAYRLQIMDLSGSPVASMLVRNNGTTLSAFVLAQLQGPATYRWRVSALNAEGDVVGTSLPRTMKVKGR